MQNTEVELSEAAPHEIVNQLLDIAKSNDALDVIGGSTSWRWQEGLISKMPRAKTVAAILTKSFNTDDPNEWISKVDKDLKSYIKANFELKSYTYKVQTQVDVKDIYESYLIMSMSSNGATKEEAIFGLCYFKYAKSITEEIEFYSTPSKEDLLSLHSRWAESRFNAFVDMYSPEYKEKSYFFQNNFFISNEKHTRNQLELSILRNKVVGFTSEFDMWRSFTTSMTDEEHIELELRLIEVMNEVISSSREKNKNRIDNRNLRTRSIYISSMVFPTENERLRHGN